MNDNQFIKTNTGLMGWFEPTMPVFNRMLRAARLTLPVEYKEDWTVIPVNVFKNGQKSHEVESGIMTFCEHVDVEKGNCLKCGEWQDC